MVNLEQVNNNEYYWEYIRIIRNSEEVSHGFIQKSNITTEQQKKYMSVHGHTYFIIKLNNIPIGFIGDVENDIRICVHPDYQNNGYGTKAILEFKKLYPNSLAKVKIENEQSKRAFEKAGYKVKYLLLGNE